MAHRIVLLNLGDRAEGGGLIEKTARGIAKKHPTKGSFFRAGNQIDQFSLFAIFAKYQQGTGGLARTDPELNRARILCNNATKVMLCMHGLHSDVNSGHADDSLEGEPMQAVASFGDLAAFTLMLLPLRKEPYNLALIMCYGARSEDYRLDHTGMIPADDLKTSFAYKYYRKICVARDVRMTARTGATGFDPETGRSFVETEAAVQARADSDDFLLLAQTQNAIDTYKNLRETFVDATKGGTEPRANYWAPLEYKFKKNPDLPAITPDEQVIRAYFQVVKTKNQYEDAYNGKTRTKYGKYVYEYSEKSGLRITAKYPKPGALLYQGALL